MKIIDTQVRDAVAARRNFKGGNTTVTQSPAGCAEVRLHGNLIAAIEYPRPIEERTARGSLTISDSGWPTRTTSARLTAILRAFNLGGTNISKGVLYWGDRPTSEEIVIELGEPS